VASQRTGRATSADHMGDMGKLARLGNHSGDGDEQRT
jgi:hypothetical protein